jgi:hypothetical protein
MPRWLHASTSAIDLYPPRSSTPMTSEFKRSERSLACHQQLHKFDSAGVRHQPSAGKRSRLPPGPTTSCSPASSWPAVWPVVGVEGLSLGVAQAVFGSEANGAVNTTIRLLLDLRPTSGRPRCRVRLPATGLEVRRIRYCH